MLSKKQEQIKVSIRMRPLLPPYEDQAMWDVDQEDKSISTCPYDPYLI